MKIIIPLVTLLQLSTVHASLVGIMDSGTDISHKDLAPKVWVNPMEKAGDLDLDGDGLPGDVNGWDFTKGVASPYDAQYNYLIDNDVKTFYLYYSHYETKKLAPEELTWLKAHVDDQVLMNKVNFVGGYIHGTHVAGISTSNVTNSKILSLKVIPTVYEELIPVPAPATKTVGPADEKADPIVLPEPSATAISVEEFKNELLNSSIAQVDQMAEMNGLIALHKVDVVNQSFGIGHNDALGFIKTTFINDVRREPTEAELNDLVSAYMGQLMLVGPKMFNVAPNSLFIIAAGNDTSDNDVFQDYPAGIQADNKIVVAATEGYSALAEFSNYGATSVDVAAPGVAITSTAPMNNYIPLSGTSQAAPFVTNIVATIKDINPNISLVDTKRIVFETVDVKSWLKGKVKTSGIVNKERAKRAAYFSKNMNINVAIAKAKLQVPDVAVPKSFNLGSNIKLNLAFKPIRPSLLIKKIK